MSSLTPGNPDDPGYTSHVKVFVDRCICANVSFTELRALVEERGLTFEGLQDATGCSMQCYMCEPYIRLVIETGQTRFVPLTTSQINEIMCKTRP